MKPSESSYLVTAELGTDWARHVEENRERHARVVTLIQAQGESLADFARRVRGKTREVGRLAGATVLCSDAATREALAQRTTVLWSCEEALHGVPGRVLSLVLPSTRTGRLPHWATRLLRGIEERDPGLELLVECDARVAAA